MAEAKLTVYQDGRLIFEDADLIDVLEYLLAGRVSFLDDIEEQREQLSLLTLIQDNAPRR